MNEWNIQSRAHACEACHQPFADKQAYHTLLFDEKQGLRRSDVCEPCWQKQLATNLASHAASISHWQGIYHVPPPVVEAIQKDTAETLLRKLIEQNAGPATRPGGIHSGGDAGAQTAIESEGNTAARWPADLCL